MKLRWAAIAAAIAILIGGAVTFALSGRASSLSPANRLVCAHLIAQKRWFYSQPRAGFGDIIRFLGYIQVDAAEADGALKKDLSASLRAITTNRGSATLGTRVARDCKFR